MTLHELAAEGAAIAAANGFEVTTWDNLVAKLAFAATELDEARDASIDELPEELADTAIRLMAALHGLFNDGWSDRVTGRNRRFQHINTFATIETLLWPTLGHILKALQSWRRDNKRDTGQRIELALLELWRLADALGIDLVAEVHAKNEINRGRGYLHGKASPLG